MCTETTLIAFRCFSLPRFLFLAEILTANHVRGATQQTKLTVGTFVTSQLVDTAEQALKTWKSLVDKLATKIVNARRDRLAFLVLNVDFGGAKVQPLQNSMTVVRLVFSKVITVAQSMKLQLEFLAKDGTSKSHTVTIVPLKTIQYSD